MIRMHEKLQGDSQWIASDRMDSYREILGGSHLIAWTAAERDLGGSHLDCSIDREILGGSYLDRI